jgi:hypothetical protein
MVLLGVAANGLRFRGDGIICSIERLVLSILGIEYRLSVRAGLEDRRHREAFGGFGHAFALRPVIMTGSHMNTSCVFMWSGARWLLPQLAGAALAQGVSTLRNEDYIRPQHGAPLGSRIFVAHRCWYRRRAFYHASRTLSR